MFSVGKKSLTDGMIGLCILYGKENGRVSSKIEFHNEAPDRGEAEENTWLIPVYKDEDEKLKSFLKGII